MWLWSIIIRRYGPHVFILWWRQCVKFKLKFYSESHLFEFFDSRLWHFQVVCIFSRVQNWSWVQKRSSDCTNSVRSVAVQSKNLSQFQFHPTGLVKFKYENIIKKWNYILNIWDMKDEQLSLNAIKSSVKGNGLGLGLGNVISHLTGL